MERNPTTRTERKARGFSLVEIVIAVGALALGLVAIIGLLTPVSRSVTTNLDAEAAGRAAEASITYLKALKWNEGRNFIKTASAFSTQLSNEGRGTYNPATDRQVLFVNRTGTIIGAYSDAVWNGEHGGKYFEVVAVRNERISPAAGDTTASTIAFTIRVRWPCFNYGPGGTGYTQFGRNEAPAKGQLAYDHSNKDVLFVNGTLTR